MNTARPAEDRAGTPEVPPFFVWRIPGTAVRIDITLDVVRRIREYLTHVAPDGQEAGGLLIGHARARASVITDVVPFFREPESGPHFVLSDVEQTALAQRVAEVNRGKEESVIGYFRSDHRNGVCLYEQDQELITKSIPP